jgi:hypothetical protein
MKINIIELVKVMKTITDNENYSNIVLLQIMLFLI